MSEQMRAHLKEVFREPNRRLAQVTGLDLGIWDAAEGRQARPSA
jgi:hypothetical protein